MKVFVVGATGVLGMAVIPRLLSRGDQVLALVRSLNRAVRIMRDGVEVVEGDLLEIAPESLQEILSGCDAAVHLATALRPGSAGLGTTNTNALLRTVGTRRLLDAVLASGVPRHVQQSIAFPYADSGDTWLDERTPFYDAAEVGGPGSPVVEMEGMVRSLDPALVEWVILRGGSFVGWNTRQDQVLTELKDGSLRVPGDGSNWVSFVHVEDYGEAVVAAIHSSVKGIVLHITDEPIRNGDYLDQLANLLGLPAPLRDLEAPLPRSNRCSHEAATEALGWAPTMGIWPRQLNT
jgi:2-alkyl-3-oxoalkanoate reductase